MTVCFSWPQSRWLSSPVRVLKLDFILGKAVWERKDALKGLDDPSVHLLSYMECVFSHSAAHVFFSHLSKVGEAEDSICNNIDFLPFTAGLQVADELSGGKRKRNWKKKVNIMSHFFEGRQEKKMHDFSMNCLCFYYHSDNLKQNLVLYLKYLWVFYSLSFKFSMLTFVLCSLRWAETEFTQGGE